MGREIDLGELAARLASIEVTDLRRLSGGASSLSYAAMATIAGTTRPVVVKAAPPGLAPVRNRDVLRQAALLRRLAPTGVPVPEVLWDDPGDPPGVPPVFVMAFVPGSSYEPLFDRDGEDPPAIVAARMRAAAQALATLHRLDPAGLGLADEPRVGLADEVRRWERALGTVDAALVPGWETVTRALLATEPAALPPAVVHGDFRLGNLLAEGPTVTAVIDWEIWSLGDPRVDLGWFLINANPATYRREIRYADAIPSPPDLAATYSAHLGQPVAALEWFQALACFKSAATWSLIVKHARGRPTSDPLAEEMAGLLPALLAQAADLLR
ncbi:phosphotransferase family protein [Frankia sp. AgB32]|uniref:phosphotransferase family protein n=1 Tax=Frankia sp. AgB32 TaxID=631119 RepID=UPI00200D6123|nr:phosphotransferase family protein [Frankia sp. AgB32]MCK9893475.1 phosphotransferase family protein [Frankia sp. AgB32]